MKPWTALKESMILQICVAIALGCLAGATFGTQVRFLSEIGQVLIQLLKAIAAPLVFVVVYLHLLRSRISQKDGATALLLCAFNGLVACTIGLLIVNVLRPGDRMRSMFADAQEQASVEVGEGTLGAWKVLSSHIPKSILSPFLENDILGIVLLAVALGLSTRAVMPPDQTVRLEAFLEKLFHIIETFLSFLLKAVPLAIFGAVAKSVGEKGFAIFDSLLWYLAAILLGFTIFVLLVHVGWILIVGRVRVLLFFRELLPALSAAFASNSSLATLPWTLRALDRLRVSEKSSRLSACIATNFNNDGILLYEVVAALLLAQGLGLELSLTAQLQICLLSILAAIGVAGIPEAGIISLSMVLATVGIPTEYLPILMAVDWFIARLRSVVNVLSDSVNALVLDKISGSGASS